MWIACVHTLSPVSALDYPEFELVSLSDQQQLCKWHTHLPWDACAAMQQFSHSHSQHHAAHTVPSPDCLWVWCLRTWLHWPRRCPIHPLLSVLVGTTFAKATCDKTVVGSTRATCVFSIGTHTEITGDWLFSRADCGASRLSSRVAKVAYILN